MKLIPIPWRDRALVILQECHPEPAERGEGPGEPHSWFSESELAVIDSFSLPKRRDEWILSRIAAKQLALDRGICTDPRECTIDQRRIGRWHVSLSHSGPYAGAAIDDEPVGIDVQVVRELRESAGHLFMTESEVEAMQACALPHRLLHFWCAKEAAWKQQGGAIPTLKRIPLVLLSATDSGLRFSGVETVAIGDLIVALTV